MLFVQTTIILLSSCICRQAPSIHIFARGVNEPLKGPSHCPSLTDGGYLGKYDLEPRAWLFPQLLLTQRQEI